jgi:hypothetical protein
MSRRSHRWRGPQGGAAAGPVRPQGSPATSAHPRRDPGPVGTAAQPVVDEPAHVPGTGESDERARASRATSIAIEAPPDTVEDRVDVAGVDARSAAGDELERGMREIPASEMTQRGGNGIAPAIGAGDGRSSCTAAQLRRFIRSRPFIPLHELRRRFQLGGDEDDVSPIEVDGRRLFVGLPAREAELLGELLGSGEVGYELLLDPTAPLVIGVFPMRPVPRS